jgi:hypothetical protein
MSDLDYLDQIVDKKSADFHALSVCVGSASSDPTQISALSWR